MTPADRVKAIRRFLDAELASRKAADARMALPPGSTRARVTSANARWMSCAEERDRAAADLDPATVLALRAELERGAA